MAPSSLIDKLDKANDYSGKYNLFSSYVHKATVKTVGNNIYQFAGLFTIPTANLGVDKEKDAGLAGYYLIDNVVDKINLSTYETTLSATRKQSVNNSEYNRDAKKDGNQKVLDQIQFKDTANVSLVKYLFDSLTSNNSTFKNFGVKIIKK